MACKIVNVRMASTDIGLEGTEKSVKRVKPNIIIDKLVREVDILKDICHVSGKLYSVQLANLSSPISSVSNMSTGVDRISTFSKS